MLVVVVSGLGDAGKWLSPTLYHTLLVRSQGRSHLGERKKRGGRNGRKNRATSFLRFDQGCTIMIIPLSTLRNPHGFGLDQKHGTSQVASQTLSQYP